MIPDVSDLRDVFAPSELRHLKGAIQHISFCLSSIEHDRSGEDVLITGPSGAGKTTTAKCVVKERERETSASVESDDSCLLLDAGLSASL